MNEKRVPLYERLPEIYRIKDAEGQPPGQLKAYLTRVEEAFGAIHENIESLYNDLLVGAPSASGGSRMKTPKRWHVIGLSYAAVVLFIGSYMLTRWVQTQVEWIGSSGSAALVIAGLMAVPLVLPFVWERLTKVKVFDLEISLAEVTAEMHLALPNVLSDIQRLELVNSANEVIIQSITEAIEADETARLIEVNIRKGKSWWATRLYLLAALAEDYTEVTQLVYLEKKGDRDSCFVGMATPAATRCALATTYPILEKVYRQIPSFAGQDFAPERIVNAFGTGLENQKQSNLKQNGEAVLKEPGVQEWVTKQWLQQHLKLDPSPQSVEWDEGPLTPLLLYRIVDRSAPFVALIKNRQLMRVVDRVELASQIADSALRMQLQQKQPNHSNTVR